MNPKQAEEDLLREALRLRKEYDAWVLEIDKQDRPDLWKPFPEWLNDYYVQISQENELNN